MKMLVVILGLLGVAAAGGLGMKWISDADSNAETFRKLENYEKNLKAGGTSQASTKLKEKLDELNDLIRAAYVLVFGAIAGLVVIVMMLMAKIDPRIAGGVMILFPVVAGAFAPRSLVFSAIMILAGGLCFLLKPRVTSAV